MEDIRAEDFADHVMEKEKDSNHGFEEEYEVGGKRGGGAA